MIRDAAGAFYVRQHACGIRLHLLYAAQNHKNLPSCRQGPGRLQVPEADDLVFAACVRFLF
jgi:hypothetical protein